MRNAVAARPTAPAASSGVTRIAGRGAAGLGADGRAALRCFFALRFGFAVRLDIGPFHCFFPNLPPGPGSSIVTMRPSMATIFPLNPAPPLVPNPRWTLSPIFQLVGLLLKCCIAPLVRCRYFRVFRSVVLNGSYPELARIG